MVVAVVVTPGAAVRYNLTVRELHTFAVGAGPWVVHNCGGIPGELADTARAQGTSASREAVHAHVIAPNGNGISTIDTLSQRASGDNFRRFEDIIMEGRQAGDNFAGNCAEAHLCYALYNMADQGLLPQGSRVEAGLYHHAFADPCGTCLNLLDKTQQDLGITIRIYNQVGGQVY